jgi:hypothetical protein
MLEMSTSDITGNYQTFLDELYLFFQEIKAPRKAKGNNYFLILMNVS